MLTNQRLDLPVVYLGDPGLLEERQHLGVKHVAGFTNNLGSLLHLLDVLQVLLLSLLPLLIQTKHRHCALHPLDQTRPD